MDEAGEERRGREPGDIKTRKRWRGGEEGGAGRKEMEGLRAERVKVIVLDYDEIT